MATIIGTTNNSYWTYKLEAYETSTNTTNNTSNVRVDVYIGRASSRSYLGGNWSGSVTVNGSSQSMSGRIPYPTYINGGAWLLLATKDFNDIAHNSDGTKTVSVSSEFSSPDFTPSYARASGSLTLTTLRQAPSGVIASVSGITGNSAIINASCSSAGILSPLTKWEITITGFQTQTFTTSSLSQSATFTGLLDNATYNYTVKATNTSNLSTTSSGSFRTLERNSVIRLGVNGAWVEHECYAEQNGSWVESEVYIEQNGSWIETD